MTTVIGVCLITAVAVLTVKRIAPEYAFAVSITAGCIILVTLLLSASGMFSDIEELFSAAGIDNGIFKLVLKCLGICYITGFAAELCRDFGQTSLGSKVELAGKLSITAMTLPLIEQILRSAVELVG